VTDHPPGSSFDDVPRWHGPLDPNPMPTSGPWIADVHSFDIPNTIATCVRSVGVGCVAVVLVDRGGPAMRAAAEQAANERGVKILWEDRVADAERDSP
jgi:hypothetical protein